MHRDSLGTAAAIRPGEVNWMTAGRGIVHSERTAPNTGRTANRFMGCNAGWRYPPRRRKAPPTFPTTTAQPFRW
jgi:redox-sensitive bicupin YhaK (pirin superfamily)